jgi:hypothetical protein
LGLDQTESNAGASTFMTAYSLARHRRRRQSMAAVWLTLLLLAAAALPFGAGVGRVLAADPVATYLDLSPETATYGPGATVTLTANVYDQDGNLLTGTSTHVRFYFSAASPNNPGSPGGNPDLDCMTGSAGTCDVTYLPAALGTDSICARFSGPPTLCDEPVGDPEMDDNVDVVEVVIEDGGPTPTPTPTPDPTRLRLRRRSDTHADPGSNADATPDPPTPVPTPTPTRPHADPTPIPTPTQRRRQRPPHADAPPHDPPRPDPAPTPTPTPTSDPTTGPTSATPDPTRAPAVGTVVEPTASPDVQGTVVLPGPLEPPPPDTPSSPGIGSVSGETSGGPADPPITRHSAPPAAVVPMLGLDPAVIATIMINEASIRVAALVKPAAAAAVATTFSFPLILMLAVLLFLVVQRHLDRRDPKLRASSRTGADSILEFQEEERL